MKLASKDLFGCGRRCEKYSEDIYVSAHVDDCLICCKSFDVMALFKKGLLTRFQGTDES